MTKVVGVSGSMAEESGTRIAVERALSSADSAGAETALIDVRETRLPVFDPDSRDAGDAEEMRRKLREADAVILGTPMYHGSYSSALKTVLDYSGFDEFEDTTVALIAVSGGRFPVTALEHLRSVCRALNAWVLPKQAAVPNSGDAFRDGEFADESIGERVDEIGTQVVRYAGVSEYPKLDSVS
ncbi:MAG: NAD(P)H-dependent oxidoreductase [Halobacteria archaeon]|nr:NAD(P)H-dependent oxidoreductase [Halobacteria archaeon]